jgi:hypothetical protein
MAYWIVYEMIHVVLPLDLVVCLSRYQQLSFPVDDYDLDNSIDSNIAVVDDVVVVAAVVVADDVAAVVDVHAVDVVVAADEDVVVVEIVHSKDDDQKEVGWSTKFSSSYID